MIVALIVLAWFSGYLINVASDYLPVFSKSPVERHAISKPALFQSFLLQQWSDWFYLHLAVELVTPLFWCYMWLYRPEDGIILAISYYFFVLITIIDLKYRLILNIVTYPAFGVIMGIHFFLHEVNPATILGGIFAFSIFFLTATLKPGTLGGGDIKLAALIGFVFGFPSILWALIVATGTGALGAICIFLSRSDRSTRVYIPYAPFLSLGALVALLYNPLIGMY